MHYQGGVRLPNTKEQCALAKRLHTKSASTKWYTKPVQVSIPDQVALHQSGLLGTDLVDVDHPPLGGPALWILI